MLGKKSKIMLGILLIAVLVSAGYFFYLYNQGGQENYKPPSQTSASSEETISSDMTLLSQAVEAYFIKNLKYPEKLDQLKPEFIDRIPLEAGTEKSFIYQSDGSEKYRIAVSEPSRYGFKELFVENGQLHKK